MMIDLKAKDKSKAAFKDARMALVANIHTISSTLTGYDESGKPRFDTVYTPMGKLVNALKYRSQLSAISQIVDLLNEEEAFQSLIANIDVIVPIPPSNRNRAIQPTIAVSEEMLKRFGKPVQKYFISSSNTEQVKAADLTERYDIVKKGLRLTPEVMPNKEAKILLFDDVLESGSTIKAVMDVLAANGYADISVLVLTIKRNSELE